MVARLAAVAVALVVAVTALAEATAPRSWAEPERRRGGAPARVPAVPLSKRPIVVPFAGLAWGQSPEQVAVVVDKILDEDYKDYLASAPPGAKRQLLAAQLAEAQAAFRGSWVEYREAPTQADPSPLRGEYTYANQETLYVLARGGTTTAFFFIRGRLWKVIHERSGVTFDKAVALQAKALGIPGRVNGPEVDWRDARTHLRMIRRGDRGFGLAYEDNATLANLATLRRATSPN